MLYDSKPLIKENHIEYSNNVIEYLEKALALDPDFRNAYSFIGIEYGARAMFALYQGNKNEYIKFYTNGYLLMQESNFIKKDFRFVSNRYYFMK